ncbi:hypothetical protein EJB05_43476, partial [Eragrostis curvula]
MEMVGAPTWSDGLGGGRGVLWRLPQVRNKRPQVGERGAEFARRGGGFLGLSSLTAGSGGGDCRVLCLRPGDAFSSRSAAVVGPPLARLVDTKPGNIRLVPTNQLDGGLQRTGRKKGATMAGGPTPTSSAVIAIIGNDQKENMFPLTQGNAAKWGDPFPISRPDWDIITASKSRLNVYKISLKPELHFRCRAANLVKTPSFLLRNTSQKVRELAVQLSLANQEHKCLSDLPCP